jgi:hypothetical protein
VLQLPINNRKENIKVVAYINKSIAISHLSSEGKQRRYTSVIPYSINIETANRPIEMAYWKLHLIENNCSMNH